MTQPPSPSSWPDPSPPPGQPTPGMPPPGQPQWNPPPGPAPFYPAAGPPGYGQPVPGYGYPPQPKANTMAVVAMIVSITSAVSVVCAFCFILFAVLPLGGGVTGTILGFVARRQIRERGEGGDGMALAGIIVGLIAAALGGLAIAVMVLWIGFGLTSGSFS